MSEIIDAKSSAAQPPKPYGGKPAHSGTVKNHVAAAATTLERSHPKAWFIISLLKAAVAERQREARSQLSLETEYVPICTVLAIPVCKEKRSLTAEIHAMLFGKKHVDVLLQALGAPFALHFHEDRLVCAPNKTALEHGLTSADVVDMEALQRFAA